MASSIVAPFRPRAIDGSRAALLLAIGVAWLVLVLAETSGVAARLHHHALIEGGLPLPVAATEFVLSWQVMLVAMMLPASMPALAAVTAGRDSSSTVPSRHARAVTLAGFFVVWTGFGLAAFLGDAVLHAVVDSTPWLAARPWLIEAGVLALAGAYQFAPLKHHGLAECRLDAGRGSDGSFTRGLTHGMACLGASWALMLLMFAEGFDSLAWMVVLASLMAYEVTGRHAHRVTVIAGFGLLVAALAVLSGPGGVGA